MRSYIKEAAKRSASSSRFDGGSISSSSSSSPSRSPVCSSAARDSRDPLPDPLRRAAGGAPPRTDGAEPDARLLAGAVEAGAGDNGYVHRRLHPGPASVLAFQGGTGRRQPLLSLRLSCLRLRLLFSASPLYSRR